MEKKRFDVALLLWLFTAGIGGHKIYIESKFHYILWYWLFSLCTFGIGPIIGAFRMKNRIIEVNKLNEL